MADGEDAYEEYLEVFGAQNTNHIDETNFEKMLVREYGDSEAVTDIENRFNELLVSAYSTANGSDWKDTKENIKSSGF